MIKSSPIFALRINQRQKKDLVNKRRKLKRQNKPPKKLRMPAKPAKKAPKRLLARPRPRPPPTMLRQRLMPLR